MIDYILELDKILFIFLNNLNTNFLDTFMAFITAKKTWYPLYLLSVLFLVKHYKKQSVFIILSLILVIILSDQFASSFCKPFFTRLRPCHELLNVHTVVGCGGQYGFISSHAANTFGFAFFLVLLLKYPLVKFMLIWAFLVSYSRIYVGVHYPLDILIGGLTGIFWAWLIFKIYAKFKSYLYS